MASVRCVGNCGSRFPWNIAVHAGEWYNTPEQTERVIVMSKNKTVRILFIGNSHTYFNDLPHIVQVLAGEDGYDCQVAMLAHGGWYLAQHAEEPEVRFNIRYGKYDYVVLQEHSHPFGPEEKFFQAVLALNQLIREAGSTPVIYATWARKTEPQEQDRMDAAHARIAEATGALLAPVGKYWWAYQKSWPEAEMYAEDGAHASRAGSEFAAKYIWETIIDDIEDKAKSR